MYDLRIKSTIQSTRCQTRKTLDASYCTYELILPPHMFRQLCRPIKKIDSNLRSISVVLIMNWPFFIQKFGTTISRALRSHKTATAQQRLIKNHNFIWACYDPEENLKHPIFIGIP